jgi:hypothetical protein
MSLRTIRLLCNPCNSLYPKGAFGMTGGDRDAVQKQGTTSEICRDGTRWQASQRNIQTVAERNKECISTARKGQTRIENQETETIALGISCRRKTAMAQLNNMLKRIGDWLLNSGREKLTDDLIDRIREWIRNRALHLPDSTVNELAKKLRVKPELVRLIADTAAEYAAEKVVELLQILKKKV